MSTKFQETVAHAVEAAQTASSSAPTWAKLAAAWSGALVGFSSFPWAALASALACLYTVHLIIGWWLDRRSGKTTRRRRS